MKSIKNYSINLGIALFMLFIVGVSNSYAQSNEDCMMCHEDQELFANRNGQEVSVFVKLEKIGKSVHADVDCIMCHEDVNTEEYLHSDGSIRLQKVNCGNCHMNAEMQFNKGIHGLVLRQNAPFAPDCTDCHGKHDILYGSDKESKTYKMNIPILCGSCHKEGAPVARIYNLTEHNILENYSQGIHGKGLYESGLFVTATCNDCHGNHLILPSSSRYSAVSTNRIARTCMKCHVRIEDTHRRVIKRELWEKEPGSVPSCTECHPPHKVEPLKMKQTVSNQLCLDCHDKSSEEFIVATRGDTIRFDKSHLANSVHFNIQCVKCHTDVTPSKARPCETAELVDCSNCHIEVSNEYFDSGHGNSFMLNEVKAPYCIDCHGSHDTKSKFDEDSRVYRASIPALCGKCHQENGQANIQTNLKEVNAFSDYSLSTHGQGLTKKGLLVSAVCTDCHTTHHELKEANPSSSIHPSNIGAICAKCHTSIYKDYMDSEHSVLQNVEGKTYPACSTCHPPHMISDTSGDKFMNEITHQCGSCHTHLSETYEETYHGKAYLLGDKDAARCSDCHGAHKILKVNNPDSEVGYNNIVGTCQQCHENANLAFTGYLTHATHNDNKVLSWTFWGMTSLLVFVFGFFGIHTLLWLPRSIKQRKKVKHVHSEKKQKYYRRFTRNQRFTHLMVIFSFILLAFTGMILKFAHMEWANWAANLIGGVRLTGNIHRFGAIITFGYFAFHLFTLIQHKQEKKIGFIELLFGKNSLMFNKKDVSDFVGSIKWFLGKGPRPQYGRWTYWEKFDYMAVFWGVAVIGFSGLILWFPEFFTLFLPGWAINVAQIIHSDEALLATGFIFTIHFFNTHLRPESFPMDTVIFTGHVPLEEYKKDRPGEYKDLVESGKLDDVVVERAISNQWMKLIKFFGFVFLAFGVAIVILIIFSLFMGKY